MLHPLIFIMVLKALSRQIRLECPEELRYADVVAVNSESLEDMKASKGD